VQGRHPGVQRPTRETFITLDRAVLAFAGCLVLNSIGLGYFVNPYRFLLTAFARLNMS